MRTLKCEAQHLKVNQGVAHGTCRLTFSIY
jgi:hypothetical protein